MTGFAVDVRRGGLGDGDGQPEKKAKNEMIHGWLLLFA
jgi:hypothetical protein